MKERTRDGKRRGGEVGKTSENKRLSGETSPPQPSRLTLQCWHCCLRLTRVALFSNVTASFLINSVKEENGTCTLSHARHN